METAQQVAAKYGLPTHDPIQWHHIKRAMEDYAQQQVKIFSSNPDVMRSLPPLPEIEQALNLGQCELRAMYKRYGIQNSNVLKLVDDCWERVKAAMPS